MFDFTILTDNRYVDPTVITEYIKNILLEDQLVLDELKYRGYKVQRLSWDDSEMDWTATRYIIFRTTWDYFDRFAEFTEWLEKVRNKTTLMNSEALILWNLDKHYLAELEMKGVNIPPTFFIEKGNTHSLKELFEQSGWSKAILKPVVSGAARHTYVIEHRTLQQLEKLFKELITEESLMLQEFQHNIMSGGEISLILFNGEYSHSVLKKAKSGDFRVQDDFGGTVHDHSASDDEIAFAVKCLSHCPELPIYARVDLIRDNQNALALGELELIEPELWFRKDPNAAVLFADALEQCIS
ncbi:MAG: RimK family alpha-L-glutamate ligase [Flavobacteriia bacterium]|jgi:glutathione synthase/RimK-type ligase-like ATP-grasp enzyme